MMVRERARSWLSELTAEVRGVTVLVVAVAGALGWLTGVNLSPGHALQLLAAQEALDVRRLDAKMDSGFASLTARDLERDQLLRDVRVALRKMVRARCLDRSLSAHDMDLLEIDCGNLVPQPRRSTP